jgi:hypothetical protein
MKYTLCFLAVCLLASHHVAAQVTEQTLVGTWTVKKVNVIESRAVDPPSDPKQLNIFKQLFEKMVFVLKADHSCSIKMAMTDARVPKGYWTYDTVSSKIEIINWQNRNNDPPSKMFELFLKDKGGQMLWVMDEKNYVFEMEMRKNN